MLDRQTESRSGGTSPATRVRLLRGERPPPTTLRVLTFGCLLTVLVIGLVPAVTVVGEIHPIPLLAVALGSYGAVAVATGNAVPATVAAIPVLATVNAEVPLWEGPNDTVDLAVVLGDVAMAAGVGLLIVYGLARYLGSTDTSGAVSGVRGPRDVAIGAWRLLGWPAALLTAFAIWALLGAAFAAHDAETAAAFGVSQFRYVGYFAVVAALVAGGLASLRSLAGAYVVSVLGHAGFALAQFYNGDSFGLTMLGETERIARHTVVLFGHEVVMGRYLGGLVGNNAAFASLAVPAAAALVWAAIGRKSVQRRSGERYSGEYNASGRNSGERNVSGGNSGDHDANGRNSGEYNVSGRNSGGRNAGERHDDGGTAPASHDGGTRADRSLTDERHAVDRPLRWLGRLGAAVSVVVLGALCVPLSQYDSATVAFVATVAGSLVLASFHYWPESARRRIHGDRSAILGALGVGFVAALAVAFSVGAASILEALPVVSSQNFGTRLDDYATAIEVARANPVFGYGGGNVESVGTELGFSDDIAIHSIFFSYLAETGFVGAGLWTASVVATGVRAVRVAWSDHDAAVLAGILCVGALGLLTVAMIDQIWDNHTSLGVFWLFAGAIAATEAGLDPVERERGR